MEEQTKTMKPEEEEALGRYLKRIKEEVKRNLDKKWNTKKYENAAKWLLARYVMNNDPECAEEASTYILAATFMQRGDKK